MTYTSTVFNKALIELECGKKYIFDKVLYHWKTNISEGSEHSIDGATYAAEVQFLFYKEGLENFETALSTKYGVVVAALLLKVCVAKK